MSLTPRVLIANRGEIAVRCINACKRLSFPSVAIFTTADASSLHVRLADSSVLLEGEGPQAYTNIDSILDICKEKEITAVFPGYGFLSENAEFARRIHDADIVFIGPDSEAIHQMGLKHVARDLSVSAGIPVIQGSGLLKSATEALEIARKIGFPVIVKASGGGGGMGQYVCETESDVPTAFASVDSRSRELFHDTGVFIEKYYGASHHIEVQVFGNGTGEVVDFGERECSIQRRRQKVVEECPSPYLVDKAGLKDRLISAALTIAKSIKYRSAGTVEFLVDDITGDFFFLEMNTRLQVEHGITEMRYGVDLVDLMLQQAKYQLEGKVGIPSDELLRIRADATPKGSAIEVRVCAENPADSFLPSSGHVQSVIWPRQHGRVDTFIQLGTFVSPYFDSLLAKIIIHRATREESVVTMRKALETTEVGGLVTNLTILKSIISSPEFSSGRTLTTFLDTQFTFHPTGIQIIEPGAFTTIQQSRHRTTKGYGIPPSQPLNTLAATIANLLVGNSQDVECLEVTARGPKLRFFSLSVVAITGYPFSVEVDGNKREMWSTIVVNPGETLNIGSSVTPGGRCYIAVRGGFPGVPEWLGSKSTTPNLVFGGIQGRQLRPGDHLEVIDIEKSDLPHSYQLPPDLIPPTTVTSIYVMHGPHDSDEYITEAGREILYSSEWTIDYNCNRTGIRLVGPQIEWARSHGQEGGSHPSNVIEYGYPRPGGVNFTGDSPILFSQDSPDLGGFICSSTVISADLWKLGALKPGDKMRLEPVSYSSARKLASQQADFINAVAKHISNGILAYENPLSLLELHEEFLKPDALLQVISSDQEGPTLTLRQGGDCFIIVNIDTSREIGLETSVAANNIARSIITRKVPGTFVHINISSITVEYEPDLIAQSDVVQLIIKSHQQSSAIDKPLPVRRFRLPIVFDHPSIREAENRYVTLQRSKAVYNPDNVSYVQENNGLSSRNDVFEILHKTQFLVVTVGFMAGLPLLWPLDPMPRLTSQKYNPTRISTPPGTVALGGGMFCIYPGDQPGGYMMLAKSIPVWDMYTLKPGFQVGKPWLFEPFDLVEFYKVSLEEYEEIWRQFEAGTYEIQIEDAEFDAHAELAKDNKNRDLPEVVEFRAKQAAAEQKMRAREEILLSEWQEEQKTSHTSSHVVGEETAVSSPQMGKVWKILTQPGELIEQDKAVVILESMKMEIPVMAEESHHGLKVKEVLVKEGTLVSPGTSLVLLEDVN
ncbi:AHS2-domain-containing protein [Daldinia caldariorum]|uniref:AHS2-domain-containing protein n=1 Tax=Daldinia caldariorum TaxID=326644 RepID=UPI002007D108|nr:AHS2-domain-containing protein [Daldinia caldariorum]KAI1469151.1 AHS2-domain-containing protein [Daldinia caldariorum]